MGPLMSTTTVSCLQCSVKFEADNKEINRGFGKFCTRSCSSAHSGKKKKKAQVSNVACAYCGKAGYKPANRLRASKNGIFFCCRKHKDLAQSLEFGLSVIWPDHYGTNRVDYRKIALDRYPHRCDGCGYDKIVNVLQVHHRDNNHENNTAENLQILCPTCHMEHHYLTKTGLWDR